MGTSLPYVAALCALIVMSAYFSATETAFSTFNHVRMKNLAAGGSRRARQVMELASDYDSILSTILIGNNIVNIGAASLATVVFTRWFDEAGVSISTAVMTVLVLIFGEISPKSMAKESPDAFCMVSAPLLRVFCVVLGPLNWLFGRWKRLLSRFLHVSARPGMSDGELLILVEEAQKEGGIDEQEGELLRNAIGFGDLTAADVLTPRVDMVYLDEGDSRARAQRVFCESGFSRLPVCRGGADDVIGVVHIKDFAPGGGKTPAELCRAPVFVSERLRLPALLRLLKSKQSHLAVVVDEHGGTSGIVTMEDVMEELVGEIWDEHDEHELAGADIESLPDGRWRVRGGTGFEKLRCRLGLAQESDAQTVGGWVAEQLGRIPRRGDRFVCGAFTVTVTAAEARRVCEIVLSRENVHTSSHFA